VEEEKEGSSNKKIPIGKRGERPLAGGGKKPPRKTTRREFVWLEGNVRQGRNEKILSVGLVGKKRKFS